MRAFLLTLVAVFSALLLADEAVQRIQSDSVNWNVFPSGGYGWSGGIQGGYAWSGSIDTPCPSRISWRSVEIDEDGRVSATGQAIWSG